MPLDVHGRWLEINFLESLQGKEGKEGGSRMQIKVVQTGPELRAGFTQAILTTVFLEIRPEDKIQDNLFPHFIEVLRNFSGLPGSSGWNSEEQTPAEANRRRQRRFCSSFKCVN